MKSIILFFSCVCLIWFFCLHAFALTLQEKVELIRKQEMQRVIKARQSYEHGIQNTQQSVSKNTIPSATNGQSTEVAVPLQKDVLNSEKETLLPVQASDTAIVLETFDLLSATDIVEGKVITSLAEGSIVEVIKVQSRWSEVRWSGLDGFIPTAILEKTSLQLESEGKNEPELQLADSPSAILASELQQNSDKTEQVAQRLRNRDRTLLEPFDMLSKPSIVEGDVLSSLNAGTKVAEISQQGKWSKIIADGKEGFIPTVLLKEE